MKKILLTTVRRLNIKISDLEIVTRQLLSLFDQVYISISNDTSSLLKQFLNNNQVYKCLIIPPRGAADARRRIVRFALTEEEKDLYYFYCDFDKIVTAVLKENENFQKYISNLHEVNGFKIIGRDKEAFLTYPSTWIETESITNKAASDVFDFHEVDIVAGCCAFDQKSAVEITNLSEGDLTDVEWPLICKYKGKRISFDSVNFLKFYYEYNKSRTDYNWRGYIGRVELSLKALKCLNYWDQLIKKNKSNEV